MRLQCTQVCVCVCVLWLLILMTKQNILFCWKVGSENIWSEWKSESRFKGFGRNHKHAFSAALFEGKLFYFLPSPPSILLSCVLQQLVPSPSPVLLHRSHFIRHPRQDAALIFLAPFHTSDHQPATQLFQFHWISHSKHDCPPADEDKRTEDGNLGISVSNTGNE